MKPRTQEKPIVDPVCGMSANPETAKKRRSSRDNIIIFAQKPVVKHLKKILKNIWDRNVLNLEAGTVAICSDLKKERFTQGWTSWVFLPIRVL